MGTVQPARCPWPPHRADAGPPHHGSVWQEEAAQLAHGTRDHGSRDREARHTIHPGWCCLGLSVLPGAPAALGKTRSFGTAGKAHLGEEVGVTAWPPHPALPSSPDWPSPQSSGSRSITEKTQGLSRAWSVRLISICSLLPQCTVSWSPPRDPNLSCQERLMEPGRDAGPATGGLAGLGVSAPDPGGPRRGCAVTH